MQQATSVPLHNINFYFLFLFDFFLFKSHIIQFVLFKHLLAIFGLLFKPTDVIYILKSYATQLLLSTVF